MNKKVSDVLTTTSQRVVVIVSIFLFLVSVGIFSYASITGVRYTGLNENKINNCKIDVSFKEGKGINLTNTYPMDYVDAKSYSPYTFYIKNNSGSCDNLLYKITMENTCTGDVIDDEFISYELVNVDTENVIRGDGINNLNETFNLRSGSIDSYEMRIWINEKAKSADLYVNGDSNNPKKYCGRLNAEILTGVKLLKNEILGDNKAHVLGVLPDTSLKTTYNVTSENGLYVSTDTNDGKETYYYRGNVENNYVSFANMLWRIVRINTDGSIRLMLEDGINNNAESQFNTKSNSYTYTYYSNSDGVKKVVDSWYNDNLKSYEASITDTEFCEEYKTAYNALNVTSGLATGIIPGSYISNFKCNTDKNGKGVLNLKVGLLSYDEAVHAGAFAGLSSTSYITNSNYLYWLISSAGFTSNNGARAWSVGKDGFIYGNGVGGTKSVRPVISVKGDTLVTGQGTKDMPYVVK